MSEKSGREAEKNAGIRQLINHGTEIAGGAVGGGVGFLLGGPVGALVGGASGPIAAIALRRIGQEISERHLGTREKIRVGGALVIAAEEIRRRLKNGERLREDGFFDEKQTGRSDAEEVAESVLLKVQREPEEKKIEYMGYLLTSISFDPEISVHMAHQLIKAAEQLTYRQLCILKICAAKDDFELRDNNYRECEFLEDDLYEVLYECSDLYSKEYIHFGLDTITFEPNVLSKLRSVKPSGMAFQRIGDYLYNLMKLSQIPDEDIDSIANQLK